MKKKLIGNQPSWRFTSSTVEVYVTGQGGHVAPVVFDRKGKKIKPYTIPPWSDEKLPKSLPPLLKVLRGDFFCMPFGGNDTPFNNECHPPHGETANRKWKFRDLTKKDGRVTFHARMKTKVRKSTVDKKITLINGHNAVYSTHIISGMSGEMTFGHHPVLRFPDSPGSGLISTSPFTYGMVSVLPVEKPEEKGYSCLKNGTKFQSLEKVQMLTGEYTDLTTYPARRGFEDIVTLVNEPSGPFAWTAATFPEKRYVWFSLKDPAVLKYTLLWMSNGGRYYAPWNGRHINMMGLEEVTSYFHYGLAESVEKNRISDGGDETYFTIKPDKPFVVNYITAAIEIPEGFDRVKSIEPVKGESAVVLTSESGIDITTPLEYEFLHTEK